MTPHETFLLEAFDKFVGLHRTDLTIDERDDLALRVCQLALDELLEGKDEH